MMEMGATPKRPSTTQPMLRTVAADPEGLPGSNPAAVTTEDKDPQFSEALSAVLAKLRAANLLLEVEGSLRTPNPDLKGTVVRIKGNRKIAILDQSPAQNDPQLEMILNLLDGVIIPGPGKEPLFAKRLQNFIADEMMP